MTIICIRHGESEGNINGDVTGSDPILTQLGKQQADRLGHILLNSGITGIYSSDLKRAWETANIIGGIIGMDIRCTDRLRERYFGSLEGLTHDEVLQRYRTKWSDFYNLPHEKQMTWKLEPEMETYDDVYRRVVSWFDEIDKSSHGTILAVTHANVMLSLLTHLGYATLSDLPRGSISNTGMLRLEKRINGWVITDTTGITRKIA